MFNIDYWSLWRWWLYDKNGWISVESSFVLVAKISEVYITLDQLTTGIIDPESLSFLAVVFSSLFKHLTILHISFALASDLQISLVHRKSRFIFQDHLGLRAINQHWPIDYHNICARDFYDAFFYGDRRASFRLSIISGLQTSFLERLYLFIP